MNQKTRPIRPDYDSPNYDVNNIAPYILEDPLTFVDGSKVKNEKDWRNRRQEILDIFAREMYGVQPPDPEDLIIEQMDEKKGALAGFADRILYKMYFRKDKSGPCINWMLLRPRYAEENVPVILFLNYRGNFELLPDQDIPVMDAWIRNNETVHNHHAQEEKRGCACNPNSDSIFPVSTIIARGYAVLTACYAEVSPDPDSQEEDETFRQDQFAYTGVFSLWGERDESRTDNITALGAWAWALSRGLDLAAKIKGLDITRSVATGCSRLGKSALLAAARDERFAVCVPNQCGGGGVCLSKRDFGENIATEMRMFSHWYCKAYKKYEINPAELLSFDQHLLVAAIAPRPLLVQGFDSSLWMDTESEYLACKAASPVWEFLGKPGLPQVGYPDNYDTSCIGTHLGYVRRSEGHGISAYDWHWMLNFADQAFRQ